jgi:membrane-bound inhibitor of C-type lysozyme
MRRPTREGLILLTLCCLGLLILARHGAAEDLTVHLAGTGPFTRRLIDYQCDAVGASLGLRASRFSVEYLNSDSNSLAILPVAGHSLIFVSVISASGARYAAQRYIWWEAAGRAVTFSADSPLGQQQSSCRRVNER